jgi:hypothetical protein
MRRTNGTTVCVHQGCDIARFRFKKGQQQDNPVRRVALCGIRWALAPLLVFCACACAAEESSYKGEINGFGGMQHFPGTTKGMLGGTIAAPLGQNSQIFGETSYTPMGEGTKLVNLGGGLDLGFRRSIGKFAPFVTVLGGVGRLSGFGASEKDATFGAGFGARYFLARNWGVRPEFRWQRYQASGGGVNSYVFRVGLFYRFGSR